MVDTLDVRELPAIRFHQVPGRVTRCFHDGKKWKVEVSTDPATMWRELTDAELVHHEEIIKRLASLA